MTSILVLSTGKKCAPADTAALYAKNAAFWPTVSTELRIKPQETADYFNWFAAVSLIASSLAAVEWLRYGD